MWDSVASAFTTAFDFAVDKGGELLSSAFKSGNIGTTLGGIGSVVSAVGNIKQARKQQKQWDKAFNMQYDNSKKEEEKKDRISKSFNLAFEEPTNE